MPTTPLFQQIPKMWGHCFDPECPQREQCLRHLTGQMLIEAGPKEPPPTMGMAVFPTARKQDKCSHFVEPRVVHLARGFSHLYDEVKHCDAQGLRNAVLSFLGSEGSYYRTAHCKRWLTPEEQEGLVALFRERGYTVPLTFDEEIDTYDYSR